MVFTIAADRRVVKSDFGVGKDSVAEGPSAGQLGQNRFNSAGNG
jgi:hypothetical protein